MVGRGTDRGTDVPGRVIGIDLRNTAARLGHGGGGATTLRHYADPVSEVDRRAAAYLAQLTTGNDKSTAAGRPDPEPARLKKVRTDRAHSSAAAARAQCFAKTSVALVSSRLLAAFDFRVFAWLVIWSASALAQA
jgi:hypothetical protein